MLYVVTGPPASGKTTWVRKRAKHGDIIIDLDAIAAALTVGSDGHTHPHPVLRTAQRARSVAIDEAIKHSSTTDVYVIHTLPKPDTMQRYRDHGAQVVTIDPGRDVVEQRITEQRHHTAHAMAARWYAAHHQATHMITEQSRSW